MISRLSELLRNARTRKATASLAAAEPDALVLSVTERENEKRVVTRMMRVSGKWRVVRSAGSKGPVDLVAWRTPGDVENYPSYRRIVAIQCKRNGVCGLGERGLLTRACVGLTDEIYVVRSVRGKLEVRSVRGWAFDGWEPLEDVL